MSEVTCKVIPTKNNEKIFTVKTFSYKGQDYEIADIGVEENGRKIFLANISFQQFLT